MFFPQLTEPTRSQEFTQQWLGYNHNLRVSDGEFWDMANMTGDAYPVAMPRGKRAWKKTPWVTGMAVKSGHLITVQGSHIYVDGTQVPFLYAGGNRAHIVAMGANVIVFPAGAYFNLVEFLSLSEGETDCSQGYIGVTNTASATLGDITVTVCRQDGTAYDSLVFGVEAPEDTAVAWVDTSGDSPALKRYDSGLASWIELTAYVKISGAGIGNRINSGDGVEINGTPIASHAVGIVGTKVVESADKNYIVIPGIVGEADYKISPIGEDGTAFVTVTRSFPKMDFVIEAGNRLWGCYYGRKETWGDTTPDGEDYTPEYGDVINEIYACALGDFKNWNKFQGISTDSYAASRGSDGEWTGAITYNGNPTFFKADCIETVYISTSGAHQITSASRRGVMASERQSAGNSLAIVNEVLYYYTGRDVVAYDGTYPQSVSAKLNAPGYKNAVAGSLGNKYYLSLYDDERGSMLVVYDTASGLWHKEDGTAVRRFTGDFQRLYCTADKDPSADPDLLICINAEDMDQTWETEGEVTWMAETGDIGLNAPGRKYISRLNLRMAAAKGAWVDVYVQYDSSPLWQRVGRMHGNGDLRSRVFPIIPTRCDHMRVRVKGCGEVKIYSLGKIYEEGGDYL